MPNVLPTIPNDPPQGIQALLDKVYLWNPDVSNELIEKINALLAKLGDAIGAIRPYNEVVAPINQYEPCYYGDGVYVAKNYLEERAEEFNEDDWILIARKEITADNIYINFAGQEETLQNAIDTLKTDQDELGDQVSTIESKIPADASETNQLVTKNEVLALPTFTYKVVNELPETGEERVIYLVPKAGEDNDIHDEYIWVNGAYELIGTTEVDLSGYLPLSGGEISGAINYNVGKLQTYNWKDAPLFTATFAAPGGVFTFNKAGIYADSGGISIGLENKSAPILSFRLFSDLIEPPLGATVELGTASNLFKSVGTKKLVSGIDTSDYSKFEIIVPEKKGTIALIEDIAESVTTKDLTVGTDEGTLNIGITAGVATIATNNGLDIVSQTKFDTAPTTDDATAWDDVNATALVTKAQVTTALSTAVGGTSVTIRNWA